MTRKIVAVLVILFSSAITLVAGAQQKKHHSVLGIEYIGEQDHLIGPIVISDSQEGADWFSKVVLKRPKAGFYYTPEFVVSAPLISSLISEAEVHRGVAQRELADARETTLVVRVTLVTPHGRSRFLINRLLGFSTLESFKGLCKDNQPLQSALSQFQEEMRP